MQASAGADVIRRLADDDPSALTDAHRMHASRCRAVAYRVLRDDAAAEDAVQEAFLALWRHRSGLVVREAGIGPWLAVAARNAALNIARAAARRATRENAAAVPEAMSDPEETALRGIDAQGLRTAIAVLPEEQRAVIRLAYFGGRTLSEVAAATGAPLGTVKRRAQLALARLARLLGATTS